MRPTFPRRILAASILFAALTTGANAADCTWAKARRATVPEIAAHPDKFEGGCWIVDGVLKAPFLFESVDGVYLAPKEFDDPTSSGFRLGVDYRKIRFEGYRHVSILGHVDDCETLREAIYASAGENEILMVTGYCHYYNGPHLHVQDLKRRSGRPFHRQMGSYERRDYGDLAPAPADWPYRKMIEDQAVRFLTALRGNDRTTLLNVHFRDVGLRWEDDEAELVRVLFTRRNSPFAKLRQSTSTPQRLVLVERVPPDLDDEGVDAPGFQTDDYAATVCFCVEADCTGRWPIASFDADNDPARPYACTHIHPYLSAGRYLVHFRTEMDTNGLEEPKPGP
jgi:hypothetical protein